MTTNELRETFAAQTTGIMPPLTNYAKWLETLLMADDGVDREHIRILIEEPNSPEAAVIRTQWYFDLEVKRQVETGKPADIDKLMILVGEMLYPEQKKKALWPLPCNISDLKKLLGKFWTWIHEVEAIRTYGIDPTEAVDSYMKALARERG